MELSNLASLPPSLAEWLCACGEDAPFGYGSLLSLTNVRLSNNPSDSSRTRRFVLYLEFQLFVRNQRRVHQLEQAPICDCHWQQTPICVLNWATNECDVCVLNFHSRLWFVFSILQWFYSVKDLLLDSSLTLELRTQIKKRSLVPIKNPKWSLLRLINAPLLRNDYISSRNVHGGAKKKKYGKKRDSRLLRREHKTTTLCGRLRIVTCRLPYLTENFLRQRFE